METFSQVEMFHRILLQTLSEPNALPGLLQQEHYILNNLYMYLIL